VRRGPQESFCYAGEIVKPYVWSLTGLVVDIIGVSLLSVEAIKLENLRKLRDHFLKPLHEYSKPLAITFTEDGALPDPELRHRATWFDGMFWWLLTHAGSGALTLWLIGMRLSARVAPAFAWIAAHWHTTGLLGRVLSMWIGGVLLLFAATWIGEGYHYSIIWLTRRLVDVADFIDRRTPDGTIGLVGFFIVVVGFILQFLGTWLGRPR
jgi:hypothetical protein